MIPLVLDGNKLKALRLYAEEHKINFAEMKQIITSDALSPGDRKEHICYLDYGFKLVFSIEEHPKKDGGTTWVRHMSVSLSEPTNTRVPNIIAVQLLCKQLGFKKPLNQCCLRFVEDNNSKYVEVLCEQ